MISISWDFLVAVTGGGVKTVDRLFAAFGSGEFLTICISRFLSFRRCGNGSGQREKPVKKVDGVSPNLYTHALDKGEGG